MAGDGRGARVRRSWSDLPDDILDTVYRAWCSSSPYDHARFAAVCSSWRAIASWHLKLPALPLLLPLSGDAKRDPMAWAYSLDGLSPRKAHRVSRRWLGSHRDRRSAAAHRCLIRWSSAALSSTQSIIGCKFHPRVANRIAGRAQPAVTKIVFSEDPSSSDCVLAAITTSTSCSVALCRVGCQDGGWTTREWNEGVYEQLTDIAFCDKKLYSLAYRNLYKFDIIINENGAAEVTSVHHIDIERALEARSILHERRVGDGCTEGRWSDDLLGLIYRRCSSSCDRASFAAVCASWRTAASWKPKLPALPLLLPWTLITSLDRKARAYSPKDGRVLRGPLPWFPYGKRIVGSHDGGWWVATAFGYRVGIVNLFTRAWVVKKGKIVCRCPTSPEPNDQIFIKKVVFSKDPASEESIQLAIAKGDVFERTRMHNTSLRPPPSARSAEPTKRYEPFGQWVPMGDCGEDGLFCKFGIALDKDNAPVIISLVTLTIQTPESFYPLYIFKLHGKLATTEEIMPVNNCKARIFRVFELVNNGTSESHKYMWTEVSSLGDHALFLGNGCCKAVHVSTTSMSGEVERNRIYYYKEQYYPDNGVDPEFVDILDLGCCDVCCFENEGLHHLERIISRGYHYREKHNGIFHRISCTWIFPPQF
ncbi:hypothetical protein ACQ4PT_037797 [Festuca glaucescens]